MDDIDRIYKEKETYEKLYNEELAKRLKLQFKIDEAIEYAKTHIIEDSEYENYMQCEREEKKELLNILQGEKNE